MQQEGIYLDTVRGLLTSTVPGDKRLVKAISESVRVPNSDAWLPNFLFPLDVFLPEHQDFLEALDNAFAAIEREKGPRASIGFALNPNIPSGKVTETTSVKALREKRAAAAASEGLPSATTSQAKHTELFCLRIVCGDTAADLKLKSSVMRKAFSVDKTTDYAREQNEEGDEEEEDDDGSVVQARLAAIQFSNRRKIADGGNERTVCVETDSAIRAICSVISDRRKWNETGDVSQADIPPGLKVGAAQGGSGLVRYFRNRLGRSAGGNSSSGNILRKRKRDEAASGEDCDSSGGSDTAAVSPPSGAKRRKRSEDDGASFAAKISSTNFFARLVKEYGKHVESATSSGNTELPIPLPRTLRTICCIYIFVAKDLEALFNEIDTTMSIETRFTYALACLFRSGPLDEYWLRTYHEKHPKELDIDSEQFFGFLMNKPTRDNRSNLAVFKEIQLRIDHFGEHCLGIANKGLAASATTATPAANYTELIQRGEAMAWNVFQHLINSNTKAIHRTRWRALELVPKRVTQLMEYLQDRKRFIEAEQLCLFFKTRQRDRYACFQFVESQTSAHEIITAIEMLILQEPALHSFSTEYTMIGGHNLVMHHGLLVALRDVSYSFVFNSARRGVKMLPVYPAYMMMLLAARPIPHHVPEAKNIAIRSVITAIAYWINGKRQVTQGILEVSDPFFEIYTYLHTLVARWPRKSDIASAVKKAYDNAKGKSSNAAAAALDESGCNGREGDILSMILSLIYLRDRHFISMEAVKKFNTLMHKRPMASKACKENFPNLHKYMALLKKRHYDSKMTRIEMKLHPEKDASLWSEFKDPEERRIMPWVDLYLLLCTDTVKHDATARCILSGITVETLPKMCGQSKGLHYQEKLYTRLEQYCSSFTRKINESYKIFAYKAPDECFLGSVSLTPISYLLRILDWHSLHKPEQRADLEDVEGPCEVDPNTILQNAPLIPISCDNSGYPLYSERCLFVPLCRTEDKHLSTAIDMCLLYSKHIEQRTMQPVVVEEEGEIVLNASTDDDCNAAADPLLHPDPFNSGIDGNLLRIKHEQSKFANAAKRWTIMHRVYEGLETATRNIMPQYGPYIITYEHARTRALKRQLNRRKTKYRANTITEQSRKTIEDIRRAEEEATPLQNGSVSGGANPLKNGRIESVIENLGAYVDCMRRSSIALLFLVDEMKYWYQWTEWYRLRVLDLEETAKDPQQFPLSMIVRRVKEERLQNGKSTGVGEQDPMLVDSSSV